MADKKSLSDLAELTQEAPAEPAAEAPAAAESEAAVPEAPPTAPLREQQLDAQGRAYVAVDHFNPGLAPADRAIRHGLISLFDMCARAQRRELAIATGPVRAAQTGICQAHKSAKHDQVQSQEPGQVNQLAVALADIGHKLIRCVNCSAVCVYRCEP